MGIDIPGFKRIEYSLRYIYGIGPHRAKEVTEKAKIDPGKKANDLTDEEIRSITSLLQSDYIIEGDLRREVQANIRRLISINTAGWMSPSSSLYFFRITASTASGISLHELPLLNTTPPRSSVSGPTSEPRGPYPICRFISVTS